MNALPPPPGVPQMPPGFTLDPVPRAMRLHYVSPRELDGLAAQGLSASVYLAFFCLLFGCFVTLVTVVNVSGQSMTDRAYAIYVACAIGSAILAALCLLLFVIALYRAIGDLRELKRDPRVAGGGLV
jgi:ABC-type amino acid transport system permease subunit